MSWSSSAPSGVSFASSTKVTDSKIWNYFAAYPMSVWTARGDGDTYYVKVTVTWAEGQNGSYTKDNDGIYWYVGSDKQNFAMPSSGGNQTKYYTGSRGSSGSVTVGVSPNSNLSNAAEVTSASIPAATYAVTYKANGGSGSTSSQTKTYNTSLTLRQNGFTRTGYNFTGWNTKANGSGTSYAAGASYTKNAELTLYAQWVKANIPVYVNVGGTIHQVEKAYVNVNGTIKEATVYANVGGEIKTFV